MTVEEIIDKLKASQRDTTIEIDLSDGDTMKIEYTMTDEFIINYFDHQKILKSEVFPTEAAFILFLKEQFNKKLI